jgi:hypothetical protein
MRLASASAASIFASPRWSTGAFVGVTVRGDAQGAFVGVTVRGDAQGGFVGVTFRDAAACRASRKLFPQGGFDVGGRMNDFSSPSPCDTQASSFGNGRRTDESARSARDYRRVKIYSTRYNLN